MLDTVKSRADSARDLSPYDIRNYYGKKPPEKAFAPAVRGKQKPTWARPPTQGRIYVIRVAQFIKIGFTTQLVGRLEEIQTCNALPVTLLTQFPGTFAEEKLLHKRFAKTRVRENGEWFTVDDELRSWLNEVRVAYPPIMTDPLAFRHGKFKRGEDGSP